MATATTAYSIFHFECGLWHEVSPERFVCPVTSESFQVTVPSRPMVILHWKDRRVICVSCGLEVEAGREVDGLDDLLAVYREHRGHGVTSW